MHHMPPKVPAVPYGTTILEINISFFFGRSKFSIVQNLLFVKPLDRRNTITHPKVMEDAPHVARLSSVGARLNTEKSKFHFSTPQNHQFWRYYY